MRWVATCTKGEKMESVILRLKSGREFRFECTSYSIQTLKQDGSLCGFKYEGGVGECPIWFDVNDIEVIAIVRKGGDPA